MDLPLSRGKHTVDSRGVTSGNLLYRTQDGKKWTELSSSVFHKYFHLITRWTMCLCGEDVAWTTIKKIPESTAWSETLSIWQFLRIFVCTFLRMQRVWHKMLVFVCVCWRLHSHAVHHTHHTLRKVREICARTGNCVLFHSTQLCLKNTHFFINIWITRIKNEIVCVKFLNGRVVKYFCFTFFLPFVFICTMAYNNNNNNNNATNIWSAINMIMCHIRRTLGYIERTIRD